MNRNTPPLLRLCLLLLLASPLFALQGNAQPIPGFPIENYTDCDVQITIDINCGGGAIWKYSGILNPGGWGTPTPGMIQLLSPPLGYDPSLFPACQIDITVVVGGNTFFASGTTDQPFSLTYCCSMIPPGICTTVNNCTTLEWHPYHLMSRPGC